MTLSPVGIALGGGRSRRMGEDKAALNYHGKPQLQVAFELLNDTCQAAYVSCRPDQIEIFPYSGFPMIVDEWPGEGPLGGILTALRAFPNQPVFILACDLPFATKELVQKILLHSTQGFEKPLAIGYRSAFDGRAEPLCGLWNPDSRPVLETAFAGGMRCARKAMESLDPLLFDLPTPSALDNINNPDEKREALQELGHSDRE